MVGRQHASLGGALLVACAVLVAGGVLAMHALVATELPSSGDDLADQASAVVAGHAAHAVETVGHGGAETDSGGHGTGHGPLDVCLALVVALGLVMLTGAVLRAGVRLRVVDRAEHVARQLHARAVARPAPDLHALSVLRR